MAVVGANKRLVRRDNGELSGLLYGHEVVTKSRKTLVLRSYGFRHASVREGMKAILSLLGVRAKISFAGGKFRAIINGVDTLATGDTVEIELDEHQSLRQDQPRSVGAIPGAAEAAPGAGTEGS